MTPEQFCFWLKGYVDLGGSEPRDAQWTEIKDKLNKVHFVKNTPQWITGTGTTTLPGTNRTITLGDANSGGAAGTTATKISAGNITRAIKGWPFS